jgi:hypothetical protein
VKKTTSLTVLSSLAVIALVASSASVVQARGSNGNGNGMNGKNRQQQIVQADVNESQKNTASYMLEEEKLAHDLYSAFYDKWGTKIFSNISKSETKHQQAVSRLLSSLGVNVTVSDKQGVFTNSDLQALYNKLYAKGMTSQKDALEVGKIVEETDIADLKDAISKSTTDAEKNTYNRLLKGSNNHLKAFNKQLN